MKHLKIRLHRDLSTSVVNKYCVKNPTFLETKYILKNKFRVIKKGLDFLMLYVKGYWTLIILLNV